ncbi:SRPBCC domain-containing protein [Brevibacterium sp.]|uniref:SRPBCC family protein n=1 Tax=Brevibacterium sp. TaxID=1701 RepID=UPI0034625715
MVAEFAAPPERVWEVYADPRQLEKVWGPPTYPATVVDHSLVPGGRVTYYMTSPEGGEVPRPLGSLRGRGAFTIRLPRLLRR